ncbi:MULTISPECIES: hypothetical protein [unclassified Methylobacterium]|uniref:hypothetical protein n=1 Tax=unclassified Methylobacterium TaxID=2615210 RepID=UPI0022699381|nr:MULTISPECIES: hypothetical protein [unclassified Methylobacterium]
MAAPKKETAEITITPLRRGETRLRIIGQTPLFQNRMASKVKQILLTGGRKKSKSERAEIKHDPLVEYRDSAEILSGGPTALGLRVVAVKAAMATAALETPGLTKTSAQRLLFMPGDLVPLYGTPQLRMDVVRSADVNKTPDIRTRCFLPRWGAEITVQYIVPQLSATSVVSLLCNAGVLVGVGDFRQEKGKGGFGSFRVLGEGDDDPEWDDLVANHGRVAQAAALADPEYADTDTADLMAFWQAETRRRAA